MSIRVVVLVALAVVVALAGCASERVEEDVVEIAPGRDASIVAVTSPNLADWICSGAVIAPRVVLTARHCVNGGNHDKTGWTFDVFFGADRDHRTPSDRVVHVKEFHYPARRGDGSIEGLASRDDDDADGDVAVLILASPVSARPMRWNDRDLGDDLAGAPIRFVGYGRDKPLDDPTGKNGVRDTNDTTVSRVTPGTIVMPPGAANPCHGDSGGPMLLVRDGVETIVAVGHAMNDESCHAGADYERVDRYAELIRRWAP